MAQKASKLVATGDPKFPNQVVSTKAAQFPYVISQAPALEVGDKAYEGSLIYLYDRPRPHKSPK